MRQYSKLIVSACLENQHSFIFHRFIETRVYFPLVLAFVVQFHVSLVFCIIIFSACRPRTRSPYSQLVWPPFSSASIIRQATATVLPAIMSSSGAGHLAKGDKLYITHRCRFPPELCSCYRFILLVYWPGCSVRPLLWCSARELRRSRLD